jgi:hypothetical protein
VGVSPKQISSIYHPPRARQHAALLCTWISRTALKPTWRVAQQAVLVEGAQQVPCFPPPMTGFRRPSSRTQWHRPTISQSSFWPLGPASLKGKLAPFPSVCLTQIPLLMFFSELTAVVLYQSHTGSQVDSGQHSVALLTMSSKEKEILET